jgi:hypothetical protein
MSLRLREHNASSLDWENIAEEIESLGKRDCRALLIRTEVLLTHLLKWRYQPENLHAAGRVPSTETAMPENNFPTECPWTFETATLEPLDL